MSDLSSLHAIVLAAGQGKRLGKETETLPKALLPIGNTTILGRLLEQLKENKIKQVTIVKGFASEQFERYQFPKFDLLNWIHNPDYQSSGSGLSLFHGLSSINEDQRVLVVHGDLVLSDAIWTAFLQESISNAMAIDSEWKMETNDEVIVYSEDGCVRAIRKGEVEKLWPRSGEYIGLLRMDAQMQSAFRDYLPPKLKQDFSLNYEEPLLNNFIREGRHPFQALYIDHAKWVNVNHPADLELAKKSLTIARS